MSTAAMFLLDVAAITVLVFGLYFPRHRRREMVVAYLVVNIGVLAAAAALSSSTVGAGLGLGLFGILSIIRLRSAELDQGEVAYYFAALALGLLGGVAVSPTWLAPALMGAVLAALFIGDHPALFGRYRSETVTLDVAYTDEAALVRRLEETFHTKVHRVSVRKVDLVNDTTVVDVRHEPLGSVGHGERGSRTYQGLGMSS